MINRIRIIIILTIASVALALSAEAQQSACDKLFNDGVRYHQTMTIASQRKAIQSFEKAKACYDSEAKKTQCDDQIKACRSIIATLTEREEKTPTPAPSTVDSVAAQPAKQVAEVPAAPIPTQILEADNTYLKFKAKGGEFKKVNITCDSNDWYVEQKPSWIECTRSADQLVIEASQNQAKEERGGTIVIRCGDKTVSITVIQEKAKKFGII
ncbi:MAG: BACON domain-containing protein [Bacteroidales bacterium]|nr:BACON domain-containing protein [Bacteroidales bacterium]